MSLRIRVSCHRLGDRRVGPPRLEGPPRPRTSGGAHACAGEQLDDGLANLGEISPELLKNLGGDPLALTDEPEKDVLGADVVVPELEGFPERQLENLLGARGERNVSAGSLRPLSDDLYDLEPHRLEADAHALEGPGGDTLPLVDEPEQDVLGADVVVVEQPRFFLG